MFTITTVSLFTVGFLISQFVYQIVYNLYFHRLSKFPGPFWASATRLWAARFGLTGVDLEYSTYRELHRKHGPIIRVTPGMLLVSDATKLPLIYSRHAAKSDAYAAASPSELLPVFNIQDPKDHAYHRKLIAAPYSVSSVRKMENLIDTRVAHWVETLGSRFAGSGEKFDFAPWASYMTYDVISDISFGAPFGFVEKGTDFSGLRKALNDMTVPIAIMARLHPFFNWLKGTGILDKLLFANLENTAIGKVASFRDELIEKRLKDIEAGTTGGRVDLLQSFIDSCDENGKPLSMEYIKAEVLFLIFAGSDTTGTTFQALMMRFLTNPEVYRKVMTEINDATRDGRISSGIPQYDEVIAHCPYYVACVRENMRLTPAVPTQFPRIVPKGGLNLDGKFIPEGTEIACNPWVVQRDTNVFGPDAEDFRPERWLDPEKAIEYAKYSFSFGYGTRVCLGREIALMELFKAPLQFLRTFQPQLVDGPKPPKLMFRGSNCFYMDMWMKIEHRNSVVENSDSM